jgi:hypothetical protein
VTAGFRQHHYGLVGAVGEGGGPRLVTVGLVEPARCRWGEAPARFAGRTHAAPVVDPEAIADPAVAAWVRARLVPKVVLATQTRVLEAAIDEHGAWVPATPLISVTPADPADLWPLAAALTAPPLTALALARHAGAGLSRDAIRLRASEVAALPLPAGARAWAGAADALRQAAAARGEAGWRAALERAARLGCAAYGVEDAEALMAWWRARLPPWRGPASG